MNLFYHYTQGQSFVLRYHIMVDYVPCGFKTSNGNYYGYLFAYKLIGEQFSTPFEGYCTHL